VNGDIMPIPIQLIPGAIYEIVASTAETGVLTLGDRYGLMAAIFDEKINADERRTVDRILRSVQRGRLRVARD
jgi:hypothetical protein